MNKLTGMGGNAVITALPFTPEFPEDTANPITFPLTIPVSEWGANFQSDLQDVTDTGSAGWQAMIAGIKKAEITFTAFFDCTHFTNAALALAALFSPGRPVTLKLKLGAYSIKQADGTVDAPYAVSLTCLIGSFNITNNAKNAISFECQAQSTGAASLTIAS